MNGSVGRSAADPGAGTEDRVPFLDLASIHELIRPQLDEAIGRVVATGHFVLGAELEAFEREWAAEVGVAGCVGVGNGLDALTLSLRALGIGPGHQVIVPGQTFVATWLAVTAIGARPIPVDVEPETANMDPDLVEAAVTSRTRAVLPVHLFGRAARLDEIVEVARRHELLVLEDAAQAHGARLKGRSVGSIGDAGAWSFYPAKNLGALGDGGAVTSNDAQFLDRVRLLRNYGSRRRYRHEIVGVNSRLDEIQAGILRAKLPHLAAWNSRRNEIAAAYRDGLAGLDGLRVPAEAPGSEHVWHQFVVRHAERDRLRGILDSLGVETLIHYPTPPHLQPAYAELGYMAGSLPESEAWARESLSLPLGPHLSGDQVARVVDSVRHGISLL